VLPMAPGDELLEFSTVCGGASDASQITRLHLFVDGDVTPKQIVQRRISAVNK
jgi:hypothetical protein